MYFDYIYPPIPSFIPIQVSVNPFFFPSASYFCGAACVWVVCVGITEFKWAYSCEHWCLVHWNTGSLTVSGCRNEENDCPPPFAGTGAGHWTQVSCRNSSSWWLSHFSSTRRFVMYTRYPIGYLLSWACCINHWRILLNQRIKSVLQRLYRNSTL